MKEYWQRLRDEMVDNQLIPRGIHDELVLSAFHKIPRHCFVSKEIRGESAYSDHPLSIGKGQTISQPYMVALMTELLQLKGEEKVLEIGAGSGYQAAILAELANQVYTVERIVSLAERAEQTLSELGYNNVKVGIKDGTLGWEEFSPYDGIVVTAGAPSIPPVLIEQLSPEGRLVIPIGGTFSQTLTLVVKEQGKVVSSDICSCVFVPLIGKQGWKK